MRFGAILLAIAAMASPANAQAHHRHHHQRLTHLFSTARYKADPLPVLVALHAAYAYWGGEPPCGPVSVVYSDSYPPDLQGVIPGAVVLAWAPNYVGAPVACQVTLDSRYVNAEVEWGQFAMFCGLIAHEVGHLFGHPDVATDPPTSITYEAVGPLNEHVAPCVEALRAHPSLS